MKNKNDKNKKSGIFKFVNSVSLELACNGGGLGENKVLSSLRVGNKLIHQAQNSGSGNEAIANWYSTFACWLGPFEL